MSTTKTTLVKLFKWNQNIAIALKATTVIIRANKEYKYGNVTVTLKPEKGIYVSFENMTPTEVKNYIKPALKFLSKEEYFIA